MQPIEVIEVVEDGRKYRVEKYENGSEVKYCIDKVLFEPDPDPNEQRISDLELMLAVQLTVNAELLQRQQDTELMLADIIAGGATNVS